MTEQVRELLSVLMDGEASEIEVHRLLRQMRSEDSLTEVWVAYQETRRVLRRPSKSLAESEIQLSSHQHLELHRRIGAAIGEDNSHGEIPNDNFSSGTNDEVGVRSSVNSAAVAKPDSFKPAAMLAIAASLVVAVFIGMQINSPQDDAMVSETSELPPDVAIAIPPIADAMPVTVGLTAGNEPIVDILELKELDADGQRRLRDYLNQHDRMARVKPNAQLVTYPDRPIK